MTGPLTKAAPVLPTSFEWAPSSSWAMDGNDRIGNCSQVAVAYAIQTWTGAAQSEIALPEEMVIQNYADQSGYRPGAPATDTGADLLSVVKRWTRDGYLMPGTSPGRSYLTGYGSLPISQTAIQRAIYVAGGAMLGIAIPQRFAQDDPDVFDFRLADMDGPRFGHAVWCHGYCTDGIYLSTWARKRLMTWQALNAFMDEGYALISRQHFLTTNGRSVLGLDVGQMMDEARAAA